jgi:hypothetical protein
VGRVLTGPAPNLIEAILRGGDPDGLSLPMLRKKLARAAG